MLVMKLDCANANRAQNLEQAGLVEDRCEIIWLCMIYQVGLLAPEDVTSLVHQRGRRSQASLVGACVKHGLHSSIYAGHSMKKLKHNLCPL